MIFIQLISMIFIIHSCWSLNLLDVCQSGIRDDGINYVHCARKSLTNIPKFSSHRFFNLAFDELILSENFITHIPAHAFNSLRIKRLIMSGNRLKSIEENAFEELENYLEELILEFDPNVVDRIPQAIQNNLANIKSLTLIGLNLHVLPSKIFDQMKKLESLTLKSCNLQSIEFNAFHSIEKQLRYLNLDHNQLDRTIFKHFNHFNSLQKLSLSHNSIHELDLQSLNYPLEYLDLSYNYLKKLVLNDLNDLQILNLQNNLLTSESLNGTIPFRLKEINLDFNSIQMLNSNFFIEKNSLEILSLQSNEFLLTNSNIFQHIHHLKKLNLARNNIQIIPRGLFEKMPSLEYLNMDRNPLFPLSKETFSGIENTLRNLSLQSCALTTQSLMAFSPLKNLERLKIQSNFFRKILPEDLFSSMKNLLVLDLQRNQLNEIPSQLPSSLRELELGNNRLTILPFTNEAFEHLSQLITLDLTSNPLHCDCHLKHLHRWLVKHFQPELVSYVQWICATPKHLTGKQLGSLTEEQFICEKHDDEEEEERISSFNIWLKGSDTVILEWTWNSHSIPLQLLIFEDQNPLTIIHLNHTENYFLLDKLKAFTNYSLCLQTNHQRLCRNITTKNPQSIAVSSSSSSSHVLMNIEYFIIGISFAIILILLILCILIIHLNKYRKKYSHSSKTATILDSYYQTTGSDTTQMANCNSSIEERSIHSLHQHSSTPMFCYCQLPSNYSHEQSSYHFYQEIQPYRSPITV